MLLRLKTAAAESSTYRCGGTIRLKSPLKLCIDKGAVDAQPFVITLPAVQEEMKSLMAACKEATFGRGSQDVLDPTYRSALCLERDGFLSSLNLEEHGILSTIKTLLMPEAATISAELYKLNVYRSGDFFHSHLDTPRSPSMFGSLVVCLPQPHNGGQLKVKSPSRSTTASPTLTEEEVLVEHIFDWGPLSEAQPLAVQWAAFYSDCPHEILPVISGQR